MPEKRLRILILSEIFPNPVRPAQGIFVERQTYHLQSHCDSTVVVPVRVFPHLRLWSHVLQPKRFAAEWQQWQAQLGDIPARGKVNGIPVFYPRYTSPPKQVFRGVWGFFAYPFLRLQLYALHSAQSFDLVHAHYASPCGVVALLAQHWMKLPVVLSVHGADVTYTAKQNLLSAAIIRWVFRNVDMILTNSSWTAQQIAHFGGEPEKVQVVRYGGDTEETQDARLEKNQAAETSQRHDIANYAGMVTLLSVGYLIEGKGHAYVLHALRVLVDQGYRVRYIIVGDGPKSGQLQCLARELGLADIVSFEGYKSHSEVWPYYADCDVFVLPSWDEAFGIVYIEALGLGKPVIGCEGEGGPEDLKVLGDCLELVRPRNVESLVNALKRLIDSPERRARMGRIGSEIVRKYFTWKSNATTTYAIYRQVWETFSASTGSSKWEQSA